MDNQKLKHGGKQLKITKDVKLVKTNISVWLFTNHLLSKILLHLQNLDKKLGLYSTGYAKIKYVWGFKLLEMLNYDTIGVLYCSKKKYKVRLVFSLIENAEVMYCWGFILLKMLK